MSTAFGQPGILPGLPDPEIDRQFYEGVPARRFVAWVLDVTLVLVVGIPMALVFGLVTLGFGFALFPLIIAATGFCYRTLTLATGSATLGMRLMGLEFRKSDGSHFDTLTAVLHTTLYMLCMSFVVLQAVSCVTIVTTAYRQSLPDMALRTTAINRPAN